MNLNNLIKSIFDYAPDGSNIHHLMAVHGYSRMIAQMENVNEHILFITEATAYLHDIGVKISEVIFEQVPKALGIHKRSE